MINKIRNHKFLGPTFNSIYRFVKEVSDCNISAHAGESAFFTMLSFFPFTMLLTSLLELTPLSEKDLLKWSDIIVPDSFQNILELFRYPGNSFTFMSITLLIIAWLSSKSFTALITGLNDTYHVKKAPAKKYARLLAIFYTFLFAVLIIMTLALLVFGNTIYYHILKMFPILQHKFLPFLSLRSVVGFVIMFLFFLLLYTVFPNRKQKIRKQIPGALLATSSWIIYSFGYSYYVDHFSNYANFYGTMTAIALLMVWLYMCMYFIFVGGLVNYLLES